MTHYIRTTRNETLVDIETSRLPDVDEDVGAVSAVVDIANYSIMLLDLQFSKQMSFIKTMDTLQAINGLWKEGPTSIDRKEWHLEALDEFVRKVCRDICTEWKLHYVTD